MDALERTPLTATPIPGTDAELWAKFATMFHATSGCWEWTGRRFWDGYGVFYFGGKEQKAHRVAWTLFRGPIPTGMSVLHRCDNPPCVRPDHLWTGTQYDNVRDMMEKGRHVAPTGERHGSRTHPERVARGDHHGSRTHPERVPRGERHGRFTHPERTARGERHASAKLTEAAVREIRALVAAGGLTRTAIARGFGVSRSSVSAAAKGKTWAGVAS